MKGKAFHFSVSGIVFLAVSFACRSSIQPEGTLENTDMENKARTTINVEARDFSLSLDVSQAHPGSIAFDVKNNGLMPHDFAIRGNGIDKKTSMIMPGESARLLVTLEAGTYDYLCTARGHEQLGMSGTLTVR